MLHTNYLSRMAERKKKTLKNQLQCELDHALKQRPELTVVKVADGARDNWSFLEDISGKHNVLDFYHAAEHLSLAINSIYGEGTAKAATEGVNLTWTVN